MATPMVVAVEGRKVVGVGLWMRMLRVLLVLDVVVVEAMVPTIVVVGVMKVALVMDVRDAGTGRAAAGLVVVGGPKDGDAASAAGVWVVRLVWAGDASPITLADVEKRRAPLRRARFVGEATTRVPCWKRVSKSGDNPTYMEQDQRED